MVREIPSAAGGILSYFTRHKTVANLLLVVLLVLGMAVVPQMRAQFFPDVVVDDVSVSVTWDGAGAEDVDAAIVQVLEPALLAVEGVESSSSTSREGRASVNLEFEPGWDMARAADDVQSAVDAITTLPEDAEDPNVRRGAWRDRVTDVVITGPVEPRQLGLFADEFVTRLFAEGVTRTTIRGVVATEVLVEVPSLKLIAHDVTMAQISDAIAQEVDADPAGDVAGANARVRTGVAKRTPDEIEQIVLRTNEDGSNLTVGDVATVSQLGPDRARSYFVGDNPAVSVRVDRTATGDAIRMQYQVEDVAEALNATLPDGVSIDLIRTRAEAISGRLNLLLDNGLMGLGLVVLLLFLFLNARTAFWVAAGIPVAMLGAVTLMYVGGLTINMISLFALIITLGIVVDDAIVVGEHADARLRKFGDSPVEAAENAARRMAMPVFAATLTTIIAFFGLTAISGRFGDLIADIPFTVIAVLAASLVECFLILPNHMAHALKHQSKDHWYDWPSRVVNRGFRWMRDHAFRPFMRFVIWARYPVLALAVVLLASQAALFLKGDVTWRFFNAPERSSVTGNFAMLEGATRDDSIAMMKEMQRATEAVNQRLQQQYGWEPVDYVITEVGGNAGRGLSGADSKDADLLGAISIELIDADLRLKQDGSPYSSFAFVAELQDEVRKHPLAETLSFRGWRSGPGGDSLDVQFYGATAEVLKQASEDLQTALAEYPEVSAVEDNLAYDKEELILELTAQGQALGFTIDGLGRVLRNRLNGIEAATFPDGPRSAAIRVELPEDELTADFLDRSQMRSPTGVYAPLSDLVTVTSRSGFSTVRRENGIRLISVTGDISEDDPVRAEAISTALETEILPTIASERQVEFRLSGLAEQEESFLNEARTGLILCLTGIYLVLAWVFASWTRPLVVMAVIPFGLVGAIWGHYIWDVPLSMFSVVGLLGMTGIIINDSIVLVTTIDDYAKDRGLLPSILDGASDRLRPVMLTTLTTVLGLAPLLYESSSQAQFLRPTVITLVYGLGFGMVLVLLVVPAVIAAQQDIGRQFSALRHAVKAKPLRMPFAAALAALALWLVPTLGHVAIYDTVAPQILQAAPALAELPALPVALVLFLSLAVVLVLLLYIAASLRIALRRRANA
ncbi:putative efflux pump membrane transporter TtgB [Thalassovita autumnalis]|uniref:Efflux pump membrane transporter TtgB n=1 Tax=Thalassovita autumnalis TaxID=2072972 RepID=A0A0N7LVY3_9RHOB|nr:efflux RND transporter permease subunit [Thalassovita autumnalis]CUH67578.1 putative efflux pump membrane transporter TtgB [Thalassovita autumnalis]CUH73948.1 putative efflux pump membrane transporter TtgB [Thalassovita autumnalis]